jgi:hypothetical protein
MPDLSNTPKTVEWFIKRYCLKPTDVNDVTVPPAQFFRGWTSAEYATFPDASEYLDHANNGYREVAYVRSERAILTYCEGDIDVTVDATPEEFEARLASASKFYERAA